MKKVWRFRILSVLMSLLIVLGVIVISKEAVLADTDANTGLIYTITNGKATITGFTAPVGFSGTLTIPSTLGGTNVDRIARNAITFESKIKSIIIPSSITNIEDENFKGCSNLTSFTVDAANADFKSVNDILYNKNGTKLVCCPGARTGSFVIPSSVTTIGNNSFYGCLLTNIEIPSSVKIIEDWAFGHCTNLTNITIPNGVTSIGFCAFYRSGLTSISVPGSVLELGDDAFAAISTLQLINVDASNAVYKSIDGVLCTKDGTHLICCPGGRIGSYTIPSSITTIDPFAFFYCEAITSITIPNNVMAIGDFAFEECTRLTSITISSSVNSIGISAFDLCFMLKTIAVDTNNTTYKSIDGILFTKDGTRLICCPGGKTGSIVIPNGVTTIGADAFGDCYNITNVTIPNSVISIEGPAFMSCSGLTSITIPESVTNIGSMSFFSCRNLRDVYFYGNAPRLDKDVFTNCASGFTVHYLNTSTGFTNPWNGYTTVPFTAEAGVSYRTHVQDIGWQDYVANGTTSGTSGQSKRLEAINIQLDGVSGGIEYRTHVQDIGWQDWVQDDALSGTSGQSKRLEAIQIRLTGEATSLYDVYYRVHAQNIGWMDWAKNGESAGTAGYSYRLEAIEIVLVKKGDPAPGPTANRFVEPGVLNPIGDTVSYKTHVQDIGWMDYVCNGATSGTSGQSKRMEAIQIKLQNMVGGIEYRTHVQDYGWMNWVSDNALSGTSGESKRLEAIEIRLTGEAADNYDIYYRVHAQNFGWMGWAKNGESAGTAGYSYRLEAVEIVLVPKGGAAPGSTDGAFVQG